MPSRPETNYEEIAKGKLPAELTALAQAIVEFVKEDRDYSYRLDISQDMGQPPTVELIVTVHKAMGIDEIIETEFVIFNGEWRLVKATPYQSIPVRHLHD